MMNDTYFTKQELQGVGLLANEPYTSPTQPYTGDIDHSNGVKPVGGGGGSVGCVGFGKSFELYTTRDEKVCPNPTHPTLQGCEDSDIPHSNGLEGQCRVEEAPQPGGEQAPLFEAPATTTRLTDEHEQASSCLALWRAGELGDAIEEIDGLVYVVDVDGVTKRSPGHATDIAIYYWLDRMATDIASAAREWRRRDARDWLYWRKEQQ